MDCLQSNDGILLLRVGSQVSRKNLLEFEALPFDCRINRMLWLVVFVGTI
jgi:hypothetical protein